LLKSSIKQKNFIVGENSRCVVMRTVNFEIWKKYKIDGEIYLDDDYKMNINIMSIEEISNFNERLI